MLVKQVEGPRRFVRPTGELRNVHRVREAQRINVNSTLHKLAS